VASSLASACAVVAYFLASVSSTMAVANAALPAFVGIMVFLIGLIIRKEGTLLRFRHPHQTLAVLLKGT